VPHPRRRSVCQVSRAPGPGLTALVLCTVLLCGMLAIPCRTFGTTVGWFTPLEATEDAGIVFAGTVHAKTAVRIRGEIVTKVVFKSIRVAKGSARDSVELKLAGGTIGNDIEVVDGVPEFEAGQRYIVFATEDLGSVTNNYLSVIGLFQGVFKVGRPRDGIGSFTSDYLGLPLVALESDHISVLFPDSLIPPDQRPAFERRRKRDSAKGKRDDKRGPRRIVFQAEDPGVRVSEEAFLEFIRRSVR
jgi:hypothetical protein